MNRRDLLRCLAWSGVALAWPGPGSPARAASLPPDPFYGRSFPDTTGAEFALDTALGKPLVVNFWATWCPPCVKEMPDLDALRKSHQGVGFVGVAIDTADNVRAFSKKVQVGYKLVVAGHGGIALMRELGNKNGGLPFTLVFDAKGHPVKHILGQVKPEELEQALNDLTL
jgi:thiol-disulfide isomerase/thioredoxin